jgi:hypothetical protein
MAFIHLYYPFTFTLVKNTDLLQVHLKVLLAAHDWRCDEKGILKTVKSKNL